MLIKRKTFRVQPCAVTRFSAPDDALQTLSLVPAETPCSAGALFFLEGKRVTETLYKVKCWPRHQHFSGRRPPWIKLYRELLDDPDWHMLSGDSVKLLVSLWMLASEDETKLGHLPERKKMIFRLRTSAVVFDELMQTISHWIIPVELDLCSVCTHNDCILHTRRVQHVHKLCTSETETEAEAEKETDTEAQTDIPPTPKGTDKTKTKRTPKPSPEHPEFTACCAELPALWNATADVAGLDRCPEPMTKSLRRQVQLLMTESDLFCQHWRELPKAFAACRWSTSRHLGISVALRTRWGSKPGVPFEDKYMAFLSAAQRGESTNAGGWTRDTDRDFLA